MSLFCKNDDLKNKTQVNHKNNCRFDNSADNLLLVTPQENQSFADSERFWTRDDNL